MQNKSVRGKIVYLSHQTGEPREFGREWFSLTKHADGQKTLRAQCEIEAGVVAPREVHRDVVYTMDARHRPIDCYNRLHRDGAFLGAGWLRFSESIAECDTLNAALGRISQRQVLSIPALSLGAHPLSCDPLHLPRFDHTLPERVQHQREVWMTSLEHDGCSGPLLQHIALDIEYVGRERISVPAGEFATDHYRFIVAGSFPTEHPTEDVWCLPEDFVFVKASVGGYMKASFELAQLERG